MIRRASRTGASSGGPAAGRGRRRRRRTRPPPSASRSIRSRSPATSSVPGRPQPARGGTPPRRRPSPRPPRPGRRAAAGRAARRAPNRSARSAASARGPGFAQSIRSAVTSSSRTRATSAGSRRGGADRLGQQRHRGGQPVDRHLHADPERVPVDRRGQLGAEPLQRQRVRGGVALARALLQRLGHDAGQPFAARRLAAGAGVEQQRGDGQVCPGRCAATTLPPAASRRTTDGNAVRAGGARVPGVSATSVMPRPPRAGR